jgi:hypothetical protein
LLKRAGKETMDDERAPTGSDGQTSEVPETGIGSEAPTDGGAATLPGDVEATAATEGDTSREPEDTEDLAAMKEDSPQPTEVVADA